MKKIFKKLLITTALVTPIAISTPLLLTSCSAEIETIPGPSIFDGLDKILKPTIESQGEGSNTTSKTFYNLSTSTVTPTGETEIQDVLNESINNIKSSTPGATFSNQVDGIISMLFNGIEFKDNNGSSSTTPITKFSKKTEAPLSEQKHFATLNKLISGLKLNNIFVDKTQENTTNKLPQINSSFISNNVINLEKMFGFIDKIDTTIEITVGKEGTLGTKVNNTRNIETQIAIIFTPKKDGQSTFKWDGLNTSHPIKINVEFIQQEKATLLEGGFLSSEQPSLNTGSSAFEIRGVLNKDVFGTDVDKVTGTNKIKEWLESDNGTISNAADGGSANTTAAINKSVKKLVQIFEKTTTLKSGTTPNETSFNKKLTTKYIKDANVTNSANVKQSATPAVVIGQETVELKNVSIKKSTSYSDSNKSFDITLEFGLITNGVTQWFGITNDANKNKPINLVLTVALGSTPSNK